MLKFRIVIPVRYASERLPGKPLLNITGRPMLQHVYERALDSGAEQIVIATDDNRIKATAEDFGAQVCMTSKAHASGTDRLSEAVETLGWGGDVIVVNLQGDEPFMPPANIRQVAQNLSTHYEVSISTLCTPICSRQEFTDPNVVKVVRDKGNIALYFSRAAIPSRRGHHDKSRESERLDGCFRHIGLYAYRVEYLKRYTHAPRCWLETMERLEQLRALWNGARIHVAEAVEPPSLGVDTAKDLEKAQKLMSERRE